MEIKYALLGFLSWKPFTGYELKRMMEDSVIFYWSGNNNQIYTNLVQLHKDEMVSNEVQHQERYPSRKIYSITEKGIVELRRWAQTAPEAPRFRKSFLIQLAWSGQLNDEELNKLIEQYEHEVRLQLLMLEEQKRRGTTLNPGRTPRENYLWKRIFENYLQSYSAEAAWAHDLRLNMPKE